MTLGTATFGITEVTDAVVQEALIRGIGRAKLTGAVCYYCEGAIMNQFRGWASELSLPTMKERISFYILSAVWLTGKITPSPLPIYAVQCMFRRGTERNSVRARHKHCIVRWAHGDVGASAVGW